MPQFLIKRPTFISHLGRLCQPGETISFDLPPVLDEKGKPKMEPVLDAKGKPAVDGEGKPVLKPVLMSIGDNLELVADQA